MTINTNKKIKKVSYNQVDIPSGVDVSNVTATRNDVLPSKKFIDSNGNIHTGQIQTMAGGTKTSNQTISTANKYLTSDIVINVNPAGLTYRWINPTIIRVTTTTSNQKIELWFSEIKSATLGINWGDASSRATVATGTNNQKAEHTYSTAGTYNIVLLPNNINRTTLSNSLENESSGYYYRFDDLCFNQNNNNHFTPVIEIFLGDYAWFDSDAFSYCDNLKTLDFSNLNSLLEAPSGSYKKSYTLPDIAKYSTISNLVLGTSIFALGSQCFRYSTINTIIIKDTRTTGSNTSIITYGSDAFTTGNITRILIPNQKLSNYKNGSGWSSMSSKMYAY